jgi:acetyl esterase/lipase
MAPLDPGVRPYVERANEAPPVWEISLAEARGAIEVETLELFGPVDELSRVEDRLIDGPGGPLRVRLYRPDGDASQQAGLVYLHGGGWVVGSLDSHDPVCRAIARRTPCVVVSVDYRLSPENRFPAAVEDAWAATTWLRAHAGELEVDRIAVGGDSAGGTLAAVVALRARDLGLPLALQVLIYPVTDHDLDSAGYARHGVGLNLTRAKMKWYWEQYLGSADGMAPEASPFRAADLGGLAPALVQTAEYDPLCFEAEQYAARLKAAGVPVSLTRYDGQIHGFVRLGALTPQAGRALDEVAAALAGRLSAP